MISLSRKIFPPSTPFPHFPYNKRENEVNLRLTLILIATQVKENRKCDPIQQQFLVRRRGNI